MGHRTFLFVHDAAQAEMGFEQCVAETNNRFALEWFAWVPQEAMDVYRATLHRLAPLLESEDETGETQDADTAIHVPYAQALESFRASIFRMLAPRPELAPALRDLCVAIESHARQHAHPVLTLDCIQMAGFDGLERYLDDMERHHAFWQQRTPWREVSFSTTLEHPQGAPYGDPNPAQDAQLARLEDELAALEVRAYGASGPAPRPAPRWRDKHENAISWGLAIMAAAVFFAVYLPTRSLLLGGLAALLAAVGLALAVFRRPRRRALDARAVAQIEPLRQQVQALRQSRRNLSADPSFEVPPYALHRRWVASTPDALPHWDDEHLTLRSWHGQPITWAWNDIAAIGYDLDDAGDDSALVGLVELTEAGDRRADKAQIERPLWFKFAAQTDAHLTVLVLRLLHRVRHSAQPSPASP